MRSTYNKSKDEGAFTELKTRPPGYKELEARVEALEKLVLAMDDAIKRLEGRQGD
jgi:hypothetical protein